MSRYARIEREVLADTLLEVGPDAPTLCAGWTARDLAAHIVVRDRRPDAAPGVFLKPLAGWTDRVRRGYRDAHPYPDLVAQVREGPRWSPVSVGPLDELVNTVEFFVHAEDARRGQPGWQPRDLDPGLLAALWSRVPSMARLALRRFPAPVRVVAPGYGAAGSGNPAVTVTGDPGELTLFLFGRQRAALVELTGDAGLTARLSEARLGL
jgi:uncharacterized protein (TIGR03085 family)